ncbi:hypothetical protein [Mesorhizobium sp. M0678]|uniref:hypothetical protein n=1 Tax=Mesorhizobium sp. M0678 TaxID=2956985 RepID=UPI0033351BD0
MSGAVAAGLVPDMVFYSTRAELIKDQAAMARTGNRKWLEFEICDNPLAAALT